MSCLPHGLILLLPWVLLSYGCGSNRGNVAGAMWGDASTWHLEQISKTAFVQRGAADAGQSVRFEFDTGPDGEVAGLRVLYDGRPFLAEFPHLHRLREIPRGTEGDRLQTI